MSKHISISSGFRSARDLYEQTFTAAKKKKKNVKSALGHQSWLVSLLIYGQTSDTYLPPVNVFLINIII